MSIFADYLVILRGGGDLATGAAFRLHMAGFPLIVLELPHPLVVRRRVALATAVLEGSLTVEGMTGRLVRSPEEALDMARPMAHIPVLVEPGLPAGLRPSALVDARMAKRNIDTRMDQSPTVVALGPGFTAGVDCHAVVETMRGHDLGRVIRRGGAYPDTGTPGIVAGKGAERVLRAPADGPAHWYRDIGDRASAGELLGEVGGCEIHAPFAGVVRGLIAPGTVVRRGLKIGDIDPRADASACFTISDKALAVGGGVLEAVLWHMNERDRATW